jgi:hypothetical protein
VTFAWAHCRSYTTAYVALVTLAGCAVAALYAQFCCDTVTHFLLTAMPSSGDALAYTLVAGTTALINFLVQVRRVAVPPTYIKSVTASLPSTCCQQLFCIRLTSTP